MFMICQILVYRYKYRYFWFFFHFFRDRDFSFWGSRAENLQKSKIRDFKLKPVSFTWYLFFLNYDVGYLDKKLGQ